MYLVLDGVIRVDRNGTRLAEYGPGAILGKRAFLETGCALRRWSPSRRDSARSPRSLRTAR
jgi:hypothetical protein